MHSNVIRAIRGDLSKDEKQNIKVVCVGDKSRGILQRWYGKNIILAAKEVGRLPPTFLDASRLSNAVFNSGYNYSSGKIIYNKFNSVVSCTTSFLPVFSLSAVQVCFFQFFKSLPSLLRLYCHSKILYDLFIHIFYR